MLFLNNKYLIKKKIENVEYKIIDTAAIFIALKIKVNKSSKYNFIPS